MPNADYFAEKAARCRELISETVNHEIAEQLRLWADEFEVMAGALSLRPVGGRHPTRPSVDDPVRGELLRSGLDNGDDRLNKS